MGAAHILSTLRWGGLASRETWALSLVFLAGCEPPVVQVVAVDVGVVESTATSIEPGLVKAHRDSRLSPPVSGRIVLVSRQEGERVKAGEPLIRLEHDLERIALEEAKLEVTRLERLGAEGAESKAQLDRSRFALERAEVAYERTFVRAPFDGILVELNAHVGEMSYGTMPLDLVMGGQEGAAKESMARVVDDSSLFVEADIDEADAGRLKPAQPARITVEALGGLVLGGRVARIARAISTSEGRSRTIRVEIEIGPPSRPEPPGNGSPPPTAGLLAGMSADIEIILERVEKVVRVPTLVVLEDEEGKSVFVVEGGRLRHRRVSVGAANWEMSEIKEGLRGGELVVIPTNRRELAEGKEVRSERRAGGSRP